MRRTALTRKKGLDRARAVLRRKRSEVRISEKTRHIAWHRTGGLCANACGRRAIDPHHVFPQSKWPDLADEPNNVVALCRHCHAAHHSGNPDERLPRRVARHAMLLVGPDREGERRKAYLERYYR